MWRSGAARTIPPNDSREERQLPISVWWASLGKTVEEKEAPSGNFEIYPRALSTRLTSLRARWHSRPFVPTGRPLTLARTYQSLKCASFDRGLDVNVNVNELLPGRLTLVDI